MTEVQEICEDTAIVVETTPDGVLVELEKNETCGSCSASLFCMGSGSTKRFKVKTSLDLQPGDRVVLNISSGTRLFSSFIVFIMPVLLMLIFYAVGRFLFSLNEQWSVFVSIMGLLVSFFLVIIIDRRVENKLNVEIADKL
jgi:positive regulator of sigma E activity